MEKEQIEKAMAMLEEGKTVRQVAKKFGFASHNSILYWLNKYKKMCPQCQSDEWKKAWESARTKEMKKDAARAKILVKELSAIFKKYE